MIDDGNNPNEVPVIVTAANEAYALPLAVMLKSIELNLKHCRKVKVYVMNYDLESKTKSEIEKCISKQKLSLTWKEVNPEILLDLKIDGHISVDTYYRLLIEGIFSEYRKVIYLDADLIVNTSVQDLWCEQIEEYHLLAVPMFSKLSGYVSGERGVPSYKLLGIPENTRTFNAGVMVLNLEKWREERISEKIINYLRQYADYVLWWDQDGLNAILYNKWRPLPVDLNVMTCHMNSYSDHKDSLLSELEYKRVRETPQIIHYAGPQKPWHSEYKGPFFDNFKTIIKLLDSDYLKGLSANGFNKMVFHD